MLLELSCVAVALAACSDDAPADPTDAGVDAAPDAPPELVVEPPAPPAFPVLVPCPPGWREVVDPDDPRLVTCDPWPEGGPRTCADDEAHFPGTPGCARVGTACPAGDWAEDIPEDEHVEYVRPGAGAGIGTQERPHGTIARAVQWADDGDVIALAKGDYDEILWLEKDVTLWGACVAETIVGSSDADSLYASLEMLSGGLRNLTVGGARRGVAVGRNVTPVRMDAVVVRGTAVMGVSVFEGGMLVAHDLVVRDVHLPAGVETGTGLQVVAPSVVELARVVIERASNTGFGAAGEATELTVSDMAVIDTQPRNDGTYGDGVDLFDGLQATLSRVALSGNRRVAMVMSRAGPVVVTDLFISDTREEEASRQGGFGLSAQDSGTVELRRAVVTRNRGIGIVVNSSALLAEDLVVLDTEAVEAPVDPELPLGYGIEIAKATADIRRVLIARSTTTGLNVAWPETVVHASDLVVRDTRRAGAREIADAIGVGAAELHLERALLERQPRGGVMVGRGGSLDASDVVIQDVGLGTDAAPIPFGVFVQGDARASFARFLVERVHTLGLGLQSGRIDAEDVEIARILDPACDRTECSTGFGAESAGGAIVLRRFRIHDNGLCGLTVAGGDFELHEGVVQANPIGANVQTPGFDITRLEDRVRWIDNDRNLDASEMPVPDLSSLRGALPSQ